MNFKLVTLVTFDYGVEYIDDTLGGYSYKVVYKYFLRIVLSQK